MNAWIVLLGIVIIAALYVLLPAMVATWSYYRRAWRVRCPAEGAGARIVIDAPRAAIGEALGRRGLEIARCSLWPTLTLCKQECLAMPEGERRPVVQRAPAPGPDGDGRVKKILVPLDGSPGSTAVLWTAGQLARAQAARVRLLRVDAPVGTVYADDGHVVAYADQESERVAFEELQTLKRTASESRAAWPSASSGPPRCRSCWCRTASPWRAHDEEPDRRPEGRARDHPPQPRPPRGRGRA
jgi:hypothetical protein